jgi:hypothetical protein
VEVRSTSRRTGSSAEDAGDRHAEVGERVGEPALVVGGEEPEQQADGDRVGSQVADGVDDPCHLGVGEG